MMPKRMAGGDGPSLKKRVGALKGEIQSLKNPEGYSGNDWGSAMRKPSTQVRLVKGRLSGKDIGNITQAKWGKDNQILTLTSGANSCTSLVVWDASLQIRTHLVIPEHQWLITAGFEQTNGELVACGGLHCECSVYSLAAAQRDPTAAPIADLRQHDGYVADLAFVEGGNKIITASGDSQCILWDVQTQIGTKVFSGHDGDVVGISVNPSNPSVFLSGGIDNKIRAWDTRTDDSACVQEFSLKKSLGEISNVSYHPNGNSFVISAGEGSIVYDIGSAAVDAEGTTVPSLTFTTDKVEDDSSECTMSKFSNSGRLLFSTFEGGTAVAYDTASNTSFCLTNNRRNKVRAEFLDIHPTGYNMALGNSKEVALIFHF